MRVYIVKTLFAQVMEFVQWTSFARIVQRRGHGRNAGEILVEASGDDVLRKDLRPRKAKNGFIPGVRQALQ